IKTHIGAGGSALVNFHRDEIGAFHQQRRVEVGGNPLDFLRVGDGRESHSGGVHCGVSHVAAKDFSAVEIHNRSVIAQDSKLQVGHRAGIGGEKIFPKVSGGDAR